MVKHKKEKNIQEQNEEGMTEKDISVEEEEHRAEKQASVIQKLKLGKNKASKIGVIAAVTAVVVLALSIYIYTVQYNKTITIIAPVGDITFQDKFKDGDRYFVVFQAADFNRIPEAVSSKGITMQVDGPTFDLLALNVEYGTANVVFEVPQGVARKAGYLAEEVNVQVLWTEEILSKYATMRTIIWSGDY